nr:MAG TPA: hypothetical protein [Caudoviricetes sp.]
MFPVDNSAWPAQWGVGSGRSYFSSSSSSGTGGV